jgi:hypothetical protein
MLNLAPRQSALLLLLAHRRVSARFLGGPGSGVRGLGDVAGHEFHGNQWKEGGGQTAHEHFKTSKGTDAAANAAIVKENGVTVKCSDAEKPIVNEALAHVIADSKTNAELLKGKTVEVKDLGNRHGNMSASLYVDGKTVKNEGAGFTAAVIYHELQHAIMTRDKVPSGQQESRVRYKTQVWANTRAGNMAKTNPASSRGFEKAGKQSRMAEGVRSASRHPESAIHAAADAHYKPMLLAVQASFNIGRKAYKSGGVDAAVSAIKRALLIALPPVLIKTFVAGGNVGVGMVPKRRAAETVMRCSRCEYPTRDKEQEHPGICVCGGYIDDVPNLNLRAAADKPFDIRFDVSDPAAAKWAREHTSKIADDISQTSKDRINEAIATALEGDGLDAAYDTILSAVGDESRADMIARTESMDSANQGALAGFNAAQDAGLLPANATKVWIASPDACDDCIELDDEEVAIDEDFSSGDDAPPAHPNCRCSVGIGAGA